MREAGLYLSYNKGAGNKRTAGRVVPHLNRSERDPVAPCFYERFFEGKSPGKVLESPVTAGGECVFNFILSKYATQEATAMLGVELLYPGNFNGVDPDLHRLMNDTRAFGGDDSDELIHCLIERIVDHEVIEGWYCRKLLCGNRKPRMDLLLILRSPGTQPLSEQV